MKINKSAFLLVAVTVLVSGRLTAGELTDYQQSWIHRAHVLQRDIELNTPLRHAATIATHNSFNALAYTTPVRYSDPNHIYSLRGQLDMDIREVELDVHWTLSAKTSPWSNALLLSHALENHLGAGPFDRAFGEGLAEISEWARLPENANEVLIIDIEDHMDGHYVEAVGEIEEYLGDLLFRPDGIEGLPIDLGRADILATGKRIIIFSVGSLDPVWRSCVFTRDGLLQAMGESFDPTCGNGVFTRDDYDNYLIRFWEDRTNLTALLGETGVLITPELAASMVRTGVNFICFDKLTPFDGRLESTVWSWDTGQPDAANENDNCAVHKENGRFDDVDCAQARRYACKDNGGNWFITSAGGPWDEGQAACTDEAGPGYEFAMPSSGYDNELLKSAKQSAGAAAVWINYHDGDGTWGGGETPPDDGCGTPANAYQPGKRTSPAGMMRLLSIMALPLAIAFIRRRMRFLFR